MLKKEDPPKFVDEILVATKNKARHDSNLRRKNKVISEFQLLVKLLVSSFPKNPVAY